MALMTCKECGKEHSDSAAVCPSCGFKRPKQVGIIGIVFALIVAFMVFRCSTSTTSPPTVSKTPEQIAAETKKEAAFQKVVRTMKAIRAANRNPESVKWETIRANDDASVICIEYRGQNGFGGMTREIVVVVKDTPSQQPSVWNKNCTKPLNDLDYAVHAL